jgi:hypothetical protein
MKPSFLASLFDEASEPEDPRKVIFDETASREGDALMKRFYMRSMGYVVPDHGVGAGGPFIPKVTPDQLRGKPLIVVDSMQAFLDEQNVIEGEFTVVEPEIGELPTPKEE